MLGNFFRRLFYFVLLLALQVLIFNHVQILGYATPMICLYFILLFPPSASRTVVVAWGFLMGLCQDIFTNTPGMNAAALTLLGLLQPVLYKAFLAKDSDEDESELLPSARVMGWPAFLRYLFVAVLIQQVVFYLLEAFSFFHWQDMLINILGGSLMSLLFIAAIESVRIGGASKQQGRA